MTRVNVRRLAAIDMHGVAGTALRRRVVLAEFVVGAAGMVLVGAWLLAQGSPWSRAFGVAAVGWA